MPGRRTLPATSTATFDARRRRPRRRRLRCPPERSRPAAAPTARAGAWTATGAPTSWPPLRTSHQQVADQPDHGHDGDHGQLPGADAHPPAHWVGHQPDPAARRRHGAARRVPAGHPRDRRHGPGIAPRRSRIGVGIGHHADPGVAVRDPGVGALRGVVADARQLAGEQLEPPGDGGLVVDGSGSAAHADDARRWPDGPRDADRQPVERASDAGRLWREGGPVSPSRGATQTATMPGPTCAPSTAPSSPHQTSRPSRLSARRVGEPLGQLPGPLRAGQVRDADVDVRSPAASTTRSSSRLRARAEVRTRSRLATRPSSIWSSGFTASAPPSSAAAAPIRPPRRRYSRVST